MHSIYQRMIITIFDWIQEHKYELLAYAILMKIFGFGGEEG